MGGAMSGRRQRAIIGALALMALLLVGGVFTFAFNSAPRIPVAPTQDVNPTGRNAGTPGADNVATADSPGRPPDRSGNTPTNAVVPSPTPAPPQGTLVYERNSVIYLLVLGGQERQLVPSGRWPRLSPDGSRVVFIGRVNGSEEQILTVDTANTRQFSSVTNQVRNPALPIWSPDGRRIAFRADVNESKELFVVDADGSNIQQVTHGATVTDSATQPVWVADGSALLYKNQGDGAFYRIAVPGGMPERVRAATGEQDFLTPSPDGSALAFYGRTGNDPTYALYVMDAAGHNERKVMSLDATAPQQLGSLAWSPNGGAILVASGGAFEQEIISLKDGRATAVVAVGAYPSWIATEVTAK